MIFETSNKSSCRQRGVGGKFWESSGGDRLEHMDWVPRSEKSNESAAPWFGSKISMALTGTFQLGELNRSVGAPEKLSVGFGRSDGELVSSSHLRARSDRRR